MGGYNSRIYFKEKNWHIPEVSEIRTGDASTQFGNRNNISHNSESLYDIGETTADSAHSSVSAILFEILAEAYVCTFR